MKAYKIMTDIKKNLGLTLVELMIALALGLMLSAGAIMMFVSNKETSSLQRELSNIQENGRFANDLIMREVRMAGYTGCGNDADVTNTLNDTPSGSLPLVFNRAVFGYESASGATPIVLNDTTAAVSSDYLNCNTADSEYCDTADLATVVSALTGLKKGSDILILGTVSSSDCRIREHNGSDPTNNSCACSNIKCTGPVSADIKVGGVCNISDGQILMVTDCEDAAIFQVTNWNPTNGNLVHNTGNSETPGNCTKRLGKLYAPKGTLMVPKQIIFYIAEADAGVDLDGDGVNDTISNLYRKVNLDAPEALVANVENMQVLYGSGADAVVSSYQTADQVTDWSKVYTVRVDLLVRSEDKSVLQTAQAVLTSPVGDAMWNSTGTDNRLRKIFSSTTAIRNRVQ